MTYAIIELGGKQYRVEKGDSVVVDRLDAKEGAKVAARALLYRADDTTVIDGPDLDKVKVEALVTEHLKGEKIRVFKYRAKKRYRRRSGHRSLLTRLEISDIRMGAAKPKAEAAKPKAEAAKPKAEAAKPKAKPAAAKKKPDEGAAQAKKAPARKPAQKKTTKES